MIQVVTVSVETLIEGQVDDRAFVTVTGVGGGVQGHVPVGGVSVGFWVLRVLGGGGGERKGKAEREDATIEGCEN